MIKFETDNGNGTQLTVSGSLKDITAEACLFVRTVWEGFNEKDRDAGDIFKELVTKAFAEGVIFASDDEMDAILKKAEAETKEKKKEVADELKQVLRDALKELLED